MRLILFILLTLISQTAHAELSKKYVIGCLSAGFFSSFLGVLNHLAWCKNNNLTPVIYWDKKSLYYNENGYNGSDNVWEYYFEPVSEFNYMPGDLIHRDFAPKQGFNPVMHFNHRNSVCQIVEEQIKIKPHIQQKIDEFYENYIKNKKTLGLHLRGTDKIAVLDRQLIQNLPWDKVFEKANKEFQGYQFYVATDEWKILELAQKKLNGKVIYYNCIRSSNNSSLHHAPGHAGKMQLGEEALVEAVLLSKCDHVFISYSNLSFAALYFNRHLTKTSIFKQVKVNDVKSLPI